MDYLQKLIDEFNELDKSDKKKFMKKTKLKKRGSIAPLILLILVVGIAAGGWFGLLPYMYNSGTEQMAAGNWNEAINTFNKISFYSDSQAQIAKCNEQKELEANQATYYAAANALAEGKYDLAIVNFRNLGNFSDAPAQLEKAQAAKNQAAYDAAAQLLANGKFDDAIKAFTALGDFSDAAAQVETAQTAKKQAAYDAAAQLLTDGKFDEAIKAFTDLGDFSDAAAQVEAAQTAKSQAAYDAAADLLAGGKFDEAIEAFTALGDFSDAAEQVEVSKTAKLQAAYDAAAALLADGKFDEAIEAFTALGDFSDAAEQVEASKTAKLQAAYDAAAQLLAEGKFDMAIEAFTALGDFSDAAEQVEASKTAKLQSIYDGAAQMLADGKYDEAIEAFTHLGDFSDAAAQVEAAKAAKTEAAYQSALALYNEGSYRNAAAAFDELADYADSADYAAKAREFFPSLTDCKTSIYTSVGRKTAITAKVTGVASIDELTIECTDKPKTSYTISGNNITPTVTSIATLGEKTLEDGVLTVNVKGGTTSGKTSIIIKDKEGIELATIAVTNTGLTDTQNTNVGKVNYMADAQFFLYDDRDTYVLNFSLKDANQTRIAACCTVDIRIENSNGVIVYEKEHFLTESNFGTWTNNWYGERLMAGVYIKPEDILEGDTTSGTVYFTITLPNGVGFSESKTSASDLPTHDATEDCSLTYPELPVSTSYYGRTTVKVTGLTYEFTARNNGNVNLKISFSGEKTYDRDGNNHSESGRIGYKLYDPEGFVAKSGSVSTTDVAVGERFRDATLTFNDIIPGEYKLVLLDVE